MKPFATAENVPADSTSEDSAVHGWKVEQLRRHGVPSELAELFADVVDWHAVARLVRRGCPPRLALEIVT